MVTSQKLILQANNAFMSFVLCSKPHAFTSVVTADMLTYCNPLLSKVNGEGIASTSEFLTEAEATGKKVWHGGRLHCQCLSTKFHPNP
jgi:hypothetical protein